MSLEECGHGLTVEPPDQPVEPLSYQFDSSADADGRMRRKRHSSQSCDGRCQTELSLIEL